LQDVLKKFINRGTCSILTSPVYKKERESLEELLLKRSKESLNEMIDLLKILLAVNSYTLDSDEVNKVVDIMENRIGSLGFTTVRHSSEGHADCLEAFSGREGDVMLIGHTDMAQTLTGSESHEMAGGRIVCPGAGDMKGGLVTLCYALKVLKDLDMLPRNIKIILSSDEEQASPFSKKYIMDSAKNAKLCLSVEPARANGAVVIARKGGTYFTLKVKGRSAHSGVEPEKGISAAEELAHKTLLLHKLLDPRAGITVNVGYLNAGTTLGNAIAGQGTAKIDVKYWTPEQGKETVEEIIKICSVSSVPGTTLSLEQHPGFQPMMDTPQTLKLLECVKQSGKRLGIQVKSVKTGGEGDAGFCSAAGIPVICGMGPVAGLLHSPEEYLETESLWERTALLAQSLIIINKGLHDSE